MAEDLEVIVVDDGSIGRDVVASIVARHPLARLIRQLPAGPAAARNTGARHARAGVICLTDDDCEPSPMWAEALARALEDGADAAAGTTRTAHPRRALAVAADLITEAPVEPTSGAGLSFAPSNNLAVRAAVLRRVPFDELYPLAAGEDRDWCARLTDAGYTLRREPRAELVHRPTATVRGFLRQQVRYGRGAFRFRSAPSRRRLEPPAFYVRLLRRGFSAGVGPGALVLLAQFATAVGFVLEWRASRSEASEVPPDTLRNRRDPDEVVQDVKRHGRSRGDGATPPKQNAIKGAVEDDD
jgi:glycosyltransferase involved in cell wall biosynthesis